MQEGLPVGFLFEGGLVIHYLLSKGNSLLLQIFWQNILCLEVGKNTMFLQLQLQALVLILGLVCQLVFMAMRVTRLDMSVSKTCAL